MNGNNSRGYLPISRGFFSHYLWNEKRNFSKAEAWLDLLQMAAYDSQKKFFSSKIIISLKRGELVASIRFLMARWMWSTKKVYSFLELLETDNMVRRKVDQGCSLIVILNYESYNKIASNAGWINASEIGPKKRTRSLLKREQQEEHLNPPLDSVSAETGNTNHNGFFTIGRTTGEHLENNNNKDNKENKSRSHHIESLANKINPTYDQVKAEFIKKGGTQEQAERFYAKWDAKGWRDNTGPIIKFSALIPGFIKSWEVFENGTSAKSSNETTMIF